MSTNFSDDLRRQLAENPGQAVPLVDEQSNRTYYVVGEDFLFDGIEHDPITKQRLLAMLEEGEKCGEVSKEEGLARMQSTIDKFKNRTK